MVNDMTRQKEQSVMLKAATVWPMRIAYIAQPIDALIVHALEKGWQEVCIVVLILVMKRAAIGK